jgi:hypothetical protein
MEKRKSGKGFRNTSEVEGIISKIIAPSGRE